MIELLLCCGEVDSGWPLSRGSGRVRGHLIISRGESKKEDVLKARNGCDCYGRFLRLSLFLANTQQTIRRRRNLSPLALEGETIQGRKTLGEVARGIWGGG